MDDEDDEDEEEVVVLGDAGFAAMRTGEALRATGVSAAATAERMEGISSGFGLRAGDWSGLAATWRPVGPIWLAGAFWGRRGAAISAFWVRLGWAPAMWEGVRVSARGEKQFALAAFRRWGGAGLEFRGWVRGACMGHWAGWVCPGAWGFARLVCLGCRVWEAVRLAWRGRLWRACVGVWAGGRGPCSGARGCARWWACVGHWVGSGKGGAGGVGLRLPAVCWCTCSLAAVCMCGVIQARRCGGGSCILSQLRRGFYRCVCVFGVPLGRGGSRVFQGWAKAHAPEDPVDGVLPAGEGVLWPGRGRSFRVSGPASTRLWAVGMAQIPGSAQVDGQRRLIHWHRQSMARPRW